jgi:hypothetical protein
LLVVTHLHDTVKVRVAVLDEEPVWGVLGETTILRVQMQAMAMKGLWMG